MSTSDRTNHEAVRLAIAGDRDAFEALFATYQRDVMRVCYLIIGNSAAAEDASQRAWIMAWRKLHQLREHAKFRSWLTAVAANEARQVLRRQVRNEPEPLAEGYAADAPPDLTDLAAVLGRMLPEERQLVALRYAVGLTSDEIGTVLGISPTAVRSRLSRLLKRMRMELEND